ncbi:MAG TPA: extracellular solute-binding protein [Acetobacteraceae bacterium]|nr:extracellular solute-binding protein [Acetobacteraceae bacterium]
MAGLNRRRLLQTSVVAGGVLAAPQIKAQSKPEKLVYVGDNGPWHWCMVEEVAPAFEKATGIKIDFTLLPVDPWRARLRAELGAGSSGIDIVQFSVGMTGWIEPHMEDHQKLLEQINEKHPDFDWNDFLTGTKKAASYDGKLAGIPYRITTGILHYQKALLQQAGLAPPGTWPEFLKAAIALNTPPTRYGFGIFGRQGAAIFVGFVPWLYSNGGKLVDFKTGEIFINDAKGVQSLEFYANLATKYKVVPPESMTWEFDDIVAGGQNDRYAMVQMFAPYGTLINDPKLSKTGGKWGFTTVPGPQSPDQGRTWIDGHSLGVPKYTKNKEWALEFIALACDKHWLKRSMIRGNCPPRRSVLEDPEMVQTIGWPPVAAKAIETGFPTPANPVWDTLEIQLRSGLSQALLGQKTAKEALDAVARDWQRSLRRAGVGR